MMMHVFRPVRASASRLLAASTSPNSTFDHQQLHACAWNDSCGSLVVGEQPSSMDLQSSPGSFAGDGWTNSQCINVPVLWPMHCVISASSYPDHGQGSSLAAKEPTVLMVPSSQMDFFPQALVEKPEVLDLVEEAEKRQGGARRQRRSTRAGASAKMKAPRSNIVAMCPDEAVNTTEVGVIFCDSSLRSLPVDILEKAPKSTVRWADVLDDNENEAQQLPAFVPSLAPEGRSSSRAQIEDAGIASQLKKMCIDLKSGFTSPRERDLVDAAVSPLLLELDNADGPNFQSTIDWVVTSVWPLVLTQQGSRVVQKVMEVGILAEQQQIVNKLHGCVHEALVSPHANYVLQKCIEIMPPDQIQFVLTELKGEGAFASRHRFGCRIVQRLLEHCAPWQTEELIAEVLPDTARLARDRYGNFVIQHILQHGSPAQRRTIADVLCDTAIRLANHRTGCHVLTCAMLHCTAADVERLAKVILQDPGQFADLSRRQYGSFVVREVNRVARQFA